MKSTISKIFGVSLPFSKNYKSLIVFFEIVDLFLNIFLLSDLF